MKQDAMPWLVLGLGKTGRSVISYLLSKNHKVYAWSETADIAALQRDFPEVEFSVGAFPPAWMQDLQSFQAAVVSPGLPLTHPVLQALTQQIDLLSDFDLFLRACTGKVIAITGTNGKSTVTSLLEKIALCAGVKAVAGGNLGIPALDLLQTDSDVYILECSSFQLQYTNNWRADAAIFLNFNPDHLDHHASMEEYLAAKQKIYHNCEHAIVNHEHKELYTGGCNKVSYFSKSAVGHNICSLRNAGSNYVISFDGNDILQLVDCPLWAQIYPENLAAAGSCCHESRLALWNC